MKRYFYYVDQFKVDLWQVRWLYVASGHTFDEWLKFLKELRANELVRFHVSFRNKRYSITCLRNEYVK